MPPSAWGNAKQLVKKVRSCDVVEIDQGDHSHFVIYVKNGWFVHVREPETKSSSKEGIKETVEVFEAIKKYRCRINNLEDEAELLQMPKRTETECFEQVMKGIDKGEGRLCVKYDSSRKDCKDFVLHWKYKKVPWLPTKGKYVIIGSLVGTLWALHIRGRSLWQIIEETEWDAETIVYAVIGFGMICMIGIGMSKVYLK